MKQLLIYMSENSDSHALSLQTNRRIDDHESDEEFFSKVNAYREHFNLKKTNKLLILVVHINEETGVCSTFHKEVHTHPIKPRIVINAKAKSKRQEGMPHNGNMVTPSFLMGLGNFNVLGDSISITNTTAG